MKYFNLRNYVRWTSELAQFCSLRRSTRGFAAFKTNNADVVRYMSLPNYVWPTKSHQWWVLLSAMLRCLKPNSILELGSGRSTIYLSEYACKENKCLVSIDQDPSWFAVSALIARFGGLPTDFIHHVPLGEDCYYDINVLKHLIVRAPDFVYLDGPLEDRSGALRHKFMREVCSSADVIILDDIQYGHVYDQMQAFQNLGKQRDKLIIRYLVKPPDDNFLCVLIPPGHKPQMDEIIRCLSIDTVDSYSRAQCTEN